MKEDRLLKIGEAARMLDRSVWTLRQWERNGELMPTHKSAGGTRYYSQRLIESFYKNKKGDPQ